MTSRTPAPPRPPRAPWTLARWVLVVGLLAQLVLFTALTGLGWLQFGPVPYFVGGMAVIGLIAIWWPNRWLLLVGSLAALLFAVVGSMPGNDPGTLRPDRFMEFITWWFGIVTAPALVVAAFVHIAQNRHLPPAHPTALGSAAVALVLALWLGGVAVAYQEHTFEPAAAGTGIGMKADVELDLTASGDAWQPAALSVPAGKVVKITIANKDAGNHVFNQDDVGLATELPASSTTVVWLRMPTAGSFQFYCQLHASKGSDGKWTGMVGTLTVT